MGKKEEIGARIRTMRKSRKMTQEDLAKSIGQSASSITMYETGRREPDFETLEALADVFNVPMAYIVSGEQEPVQRPIPIRDSETFAKIVMSLSVKDYQTVMEIFTRAEAELKAKGEL
jgi:transcriptional regulator with XRE-family HTH domain